MEIIKKILSHLMLIALLVLMFLYSHNQFWNIITFAFIAFCIPMVDRSVKIFENGNVSSLCFLEAYIPLFYFVGYTGLTLDAVLRDVNIIHVLYVVMGIIFFVRMLWSIIPLLIKSPDDDDDDEE